MTLFTHHKVTRIYESTLKIFTLFTSATDAIICTAVSLSLGNRKALIH